jgi:hypothetical protein
MQPYLSNPKKKKEKEKEKEKDRYQRKFLNIDMRPMVLWLLPVAATFGQIKAVKSVSPFLPFMLHKGPFSPHT